MPGFVWPPGQAPAGAPAAPSSNGSWSKPTGSEPAPKPSKKKETTKRSSNVPEGDPTGSDPDEPDETASQRSSTAATSDIKSMLKRRLRQEEGYRFSRFREGGGILRRQNKVPEMEEDNSSTAAPIRLGRQ